MKISTFLLLPFFAIIFFSCQKELTGDVVTPPASTDKIKTYTEDVSISGTQTVVTYNLNYDANNRVISMISAAVPGDKFLYQYNSGTLTLDIFNSNVLAIHADYFLNSSSLVDSSFQYNDTNDTLTEKYLYNSANQLVNLKEYDYTTATGAVLSNTHIFSYDNNGNLLSDADDFSVTTYDYTNLVNNLTVFPFNPVKPVNLIKTTTNTSAGITVIINHTYTFDSKNRLSTETLEVAGGDEVVVKTYTYY